MWQPEPGWRRLPGAGPSTDGIWSAEESGRRVVVKRFVPPPAHEPAAALPPSDVNHWRRAVEVAQSGVVDRSPGVRAAPVLRVEEDAEGVTVVTAWVEDSQPTGLWLADCLGRFAGADVGTARWLARGQLRTRLGLVERRGGWATLARTPMADVAQHLWDRRGVWLDQLDALPQVPQHGDPSAANLAGRADGDAVGIDWAHLGLGPVGGDLGYLSLSVREEGGPLLDAYVSALPPGLASREQAELGARVVTVYTSLTRVDWALRRVADGEGALAGKFRHPSVAPTIRTMQRQVAHIEALLGQNG